MLLSLVSVVLLLAASASSAPAGDAPARQSKNLAFFDYAPAELVDYGPYASVDSDYEEDGDDDGDGELERAENELARTAPRRKQRPAPAPTAAHAHAQYNSPIYYIRLPPQPYMFVPGMGYISQPPPSPVQQFLNVPVSFVANGKPSGIYQWSGGLNIPTVAPPPPPPPPKPVKKPDSTIHRLPGQYTFNGKPEDIFVLRDSYNSLYGDVLTNLYP